MLLVSDIIKNADKISSLMSKRNIDVKSKLASIIETDKLRRSTQSNLDNILSESNKLAKDIGNLFKSGEVEKATLLKEKAGNLKTESKDFSLKLSTISSELNSLLLEIPNTPNELVPSGSSEEDNLEVFVHGEIPVLHEKALSHWDLATKKDIIDFDLGAKVTGAGFPFYKGKGAKLQRGLIRFFLDKADEAGYTEYIPPLMINDDSGFGTGQLPDKEGQMYHMKLDDLFMIPTAEVPLTNIYRNSLLNTSDLPIKLCGYTPCFRREAGSYGKDVRGLNRLHQFDKVEIVQIQHPEKSAETLDSMVEHVKGLLEELDLPYRILRLCAGDMGFTAAITYDFEVWSAAQEMWLEVSSVSNFETFQANRLKCRFKNADGNNQLVHTLNGSALALPRIVAALLENHQDAEGVKIPESLVPYLGFDRI